MVEAFENISRAISWEWVLSGIAVLVILGVAMMIFYEKNRKPE